MRFHRPGALLAVALVLLPVLALAAAASRGSGDLWPHLLRHVLPQAAAETVLLLAGVGAVVVAVGTGAGWLTAWYRFPGRRLLAVALVLPLAMPTYVSAYAWLDVLHPAGPVQTGLRGWLGIADPRGLPLPEIRSLPGCIAVMGMVLYPYVYLAARAAFLTQEPEMLWAARGLGARGWGLLRTVGLPMAWPAIAAGASLALLETLNDVGAAEFLGVRTLTVSVYVTWITRSSLEGAAQIGLAVLALVMAVLALAAWARGRGGGRAVRDAAPPEPRPLRGWRAPAATALCTVPVLLGFVIPGGYLLLAAWRRVAEFGLPPDLWAWIGNSALLAGLATAVAVPLGLLLALGVREAAVREGAGPAGAFLLRLGAMGYALPGGLAAVGLILAFGAFDGWTAGWGAWMPPALSGTAAAVVAALVVRFLAVPAEGLDAAYGSLPPELDWSAGGLGADAPRLLGHVHLPLLRPAITAAALLVFLDAMKELPATLLLRPLNRETLATALYAEAARGTYEEGAVAALALVAVGLPVIGLLLRGARRHP